MINTKLLMPVLTLALMTGVAMPVHAEMDKTTKTSTVIADQKPVSTPDFVKMASMGDMYEIETSKIVIADMTATDPAREFAQQTVSAHTDIAANMKKALGESHTKLMPAAKLDAEKMAKVNEMKGLKGAELSDAYLKEMSMFHDKAVMLYENYSVNGDNEQLKAFATTTLPLVKAHNDHLKGLEISK